MSSRCERGIEVGPDTLTCLLGASPLSHRWTRRPPTAHMAADIWTWLLPPRKTLGEIRPCWATPSSDVSLTFCRGHVNKAMGYFLPLAPKKSPTSRPLLFEIATGLS